MAPEGAPAPSLGRVALIHSPPGGRVVATAHGSSVALRDATGTAQRVVRAALPVSAVAVLGDGGLALAAGPTVEMFAGTGASRGRLEAPGRSPIIAVVADGPRGVVTVAQDGLTALWGPEGGVWRLRRVLWDGRPAVVHHRCLPHAGALYLLCSPAIGLDGPCHLEQRALAGAPPAPIVARMALPRDPAAAMALLPLGPHRLVVVVAAGLRIQAAEFEAVPG